MIPVGANSNRYGLPVGNSCGTFYRVIWNIKVENILISFG